MPTTLAWPVRVENGEFVTVEVGSQAEAVQNVGVLSQTHTGERLVVPAYGVPDPVGDAGYNPDALVDAARRWCPGVTVEADRLPADRRELESTVRVST